MLSYIGQGLLSRQVKNKAGERNFAERAMNKVKIVKSCWCSTMLDDWFSSLMILASEKDTVDKLAVDNVISWQFRAIAETVVAEVAELGRSRLA